MAKIINLSAFPMKSMMVYIAALFTSLISVKGNESSLELNDLGYFEKRGLNVLVFNNWYDSYFGDAKITGIEFIHHGVRTATNGDVRLNSTPGQWDPIPASCERKENRDNNRVECFLTYPEYSFDYMIRTEVSDSGLFISVHLENPLPEKLEGRAGFNLEFLPSAYFGKTYLMDDQSGVFPLYPCGPMTIGESGQAVPKSLVSGNILVLASEDSTRHVIIESQSQKLSLFDGRNQAQNGWFVVRSLIPMDRSGKVVEWFIRINTVSNWIRPTVIGHSQIGYHPDQKKQAVIELDKNDYPEGTARLLRILPDGQLKTVHEDSLDIWGDYLRYQYAIFDFSEAGEKGLYMIEYKKNRTGPFRIAPDVYKKAWHPTLDVFFPVQMDHVMVNEAYRVWHGASHLDDALQAPVNHDHFDLYAQGPSTDTPFQPGEHIPGLDIGGWFDAGDYDIRTQSQYTTVLSLVQTWETFRPGRDQTTINQKNRYVDIHVPDGIPDLLQQIEHGTLQLIAQHRAVGRAINGIIVPDLSQYTHLGDAVTMTDNLIYHSNMEPDKSDGFFSGKFDDRWAFTNKSTSLNYGSIAALAAASRAMRDFNDTLAVECLMTARHVWDEEQTHEPDIFRHGNTTGGSLEGEKFKAAVELLITTKDDQYTHAIQDLMPVIEERMMFHMGPALKVMPYMDSSYRKKMRIAAEKYNQAMAGFVDDNPFGVPISTGTWAGSGWVVGFAITNYMLHKAFPDIVHPEMVYQGLHYLYGCHPGSSISFVSGIGAYSKIVAYGNNRADFSFIAGGVVPGALIIKPDFPENKEDWPFFWGENEYVISLGASYIFLVNAVEDLLNPMESNGM